MPRIPHGSVVIEEFKASSDTQQPVVEGFALASFVPRRLDTTRFDYLFKDLQKEPGKNLLPEAQETVESLKRLGETMRDRGDDSTDNSPIPSIYTYFGQFIDHDITFETVSKKLPKLDDENLKPLTLEEVSSEIVNARTAMLDLDSVYDCPAPKRDGLMQIGKVSNIILNDPSHSIRPEGKDDYNDLPREDFSIDPRHDRAALIGDPRNDENLIIGQLHVAFLRAHNELVRQGKSFEEAKISMRQHYQYLVIHDFLMRVARPDIVVKTLKKNTLFNPSDINFFMPLEFAAAAFRFGHSMVASSYNFNKTFNKDFLPATLMRLFTLTALSGNIEAPEIGITFPSVILSNIPENWIIEWDRFVETNPARAFDTKLVEPLFHLAAEDGISPKIPSLAERNLLRGYLLRMPTGQAVAQFLKSKNLIDDKDIMTTDDVLLAAKDNAKQTEILKTSGFDKQTPLWFYILAEAAVKSEGKCLGPVGSVIIAEVLIGLIRRSENSILSEENFEPGEEEWTRKWEKHGEKFELSDLLRLAQVFETKKTPV